MQPGSPCLRIAMSLGVQVRPGWLARRDAPLDQFAHQKEKPIVLPGLRRKNFVHFQYALSKCHWRAANPSRKERQGVPAVGIGKQLSAIGFYSAYPGGERLCHFTMTLPPSAAKKACEGTREPSTARTARRVLLSQLTVVGGSTSPYISFETEPCDSILGDLGPRSLRRREAQ